MKTRIGYFFSEAVRSLTSNLATSSAATITMFVALLVVGFFFLVLFGIRDYAAKTERDVGRVKVYLQETATEEDVNALRGELEGMSEVATVEYVSKEDALARARELFKNRPEILEHLPSNPFPSSLEARMHDSRDVKTVADRMRVAKEEGTSGIAEVEDGGAEAATASTAARWVQALAGATALFLTLAATALIAITIRLSIFARRREIEVMKLVGASNSFVRIPFMIEGLLCGLFAAFVAIVVIQLSRSVLAPVTEGFPLLKLIDIPFVAIFGVLMLMGIALGAVGSGLTIRRFLRV